MILVGSRKFPRIDPLTRKYLIFSFKSSNSPSCACVVRIPRLYDVGMLSADIMNDREDNYAIRDHGQAVRQGHVFPAVQEVV